MIFKEDHTKDIVSQHNQMALKDNVIDLCV